MKLSHLGIFGSLSLLSYGAMVLFSPLAYPGYDWMSMAVSDLSAVGAPSRELAAQLNSLFGPCNRFCSYTFDYFNDYDFLWNKKEQFKEPWHLVIGMSFRNVCRCNRNQCVSEKCMWNF